MVKTKVELNSIERPLDYLNQCKGKEVIVTLENGKEVTGTLIAFDIHINLIVKTLDKIGFIRGDNVVFVS
jgi:small nuclear ribonucleoprotein (snRNP)-like protein